MQQQARTQAVATVEQSAADMSTDKATYHASRAWTWLSSDGFTTGEYYVPADQVTFCKPEGELRKQLSRNFPLLSHYQSWERRVQGFTLVDRLETAASEGQELTKKSYDNHKTNVRTTKSQECLPHKQITRKSPKNHARTLATGRPHLGHSESRRKPNKMITRNSLATEQTGR